MKRKRKQKGMPFLFCVLSLLLFLAGGIQEVQASAVPEGWTDPPEIASETGVVMDLATGEILFNKDMDKQMYPASITKVMTTLLALENASLDEEVTFTELGVRDVYWGSSNAGMQLGETLTVEQCLYLMMLQSANEVSTQIGEYLAGSESGFADMMNQRAKELGCTNTHFSNASGLHADDHYTSAHDLALIGQAAFKYDEFRKVIKTQSYELPPTNMNPDTRVFQNHHVMILDGNDFFYQYCLGGKTGNTDEAHNTLLTYAEKDGRQLVAVVMKSDGLNEWTDTRALFDYAYENIERLEASDVSEPTEGADGSGMAEGSGGNGGTQSGEQDANIAESGTKASEVSAVMRIIAVVLAVLIVLCIAAVGVKMASKKKRRRKRRRR